MVLKKNDLIKSHVSKGTDRQPFSTLSKLLETGCLSTRDTSGSLSVRLDKMQIQDSIQLITPERLLRCCILLLHNNIASTNRTLHLHTKGMPSH
jgi:hypothetical protein